MAFVLAAAPMLQWSRGLTIGLLVLLAVLAHVLVFAWGYWYFVRRKHEADDLTGDHAEDGSETRG